jgi:DNA-binding NtrC family response regulator
LRHPPKEECSVPRILLVDDDGDTRAIFRDKLAHSGHEIAEAESAEAALGQVSKFDPDVIVTDVRMDGMTGIELLGRVREALPRVGVIVMTGHEDMSTAVEAMKEGAFDYLVKPVSLAALEAVVDRCLAGQELNAEVRDGDEGEDEDSPLIQPGDVVGRHPRMIEIYKMVGVLSVNRTTVLIRGETGSGKEVVARAVHRHSEFADEPFIAVNCSALSETLLESELFGHVKGAFTGAIGGRKGYFELAGKGTIFLDEIGDTSPEFQTKLLRVLQERQYFPVGGEQPRRTEARVIAATHQPMEELISEGGFREDLYFRLRVVEIVVPSLREREGDIPLLANHLLARIRETTGQDVRRISDEAMARLEAYGWPGNVRELENALTRAAIVARGPVIGPEHLRLGTDGIGATATSSGGTSEETLDTVIERHIRAALSAQNGNKTETAKALGISRSQLTGYLKRFDG